MNRLLPALVLLLVQPLAAGAEWHSTDASTFSFKTTFEGEVIGGNFGHFDLRFHFDPAHPADATLVVTVGLAAADMGDEDMNAVLFDEAWFDVARYDKAVFESCSITATGLGGYAAAGTLKLKGIEGPVTVPFSWIEEGGTARMGGSFTLQRTDFGIGTGEWATDETIGLVTELEFDVVLERVD